MKKTLVSALTTALVVGAASTTFAAANPFSDVPADHWAYDAVSQLAADGVIEGYGDTTFRGNQNITRYEMAQMIAKAMAKSDVSAADKALIDKLAAEFSDELNNLGVRVSNLERNADKVKWMQTRRRTTISSCSASSRALKSTAIGMSMHVSMHPRISQRITRTTMQILLLDMVRTASRTRMLRSSVSGLRATMATSRSNSVSSLRSITTASSIRRSLVLKSSSATR